LVPEKLDALGAVQRRQLLTARVSEELFGLTLERRRVPERLSLASRVGNLDVAPTFSLLIEQGRGDSRGEGTDTFFSGR
jgi:hypothetical protein